MGKTLLNALLITGSNEINELFQKARQENILDNYFRYFNDVILVCILEESFQ